VVSPALRLAHLVPGGTPYLLTSFMVLVERVRALIRPGTLSVRLAANIIAGHLLLTLIRSRANALLPWAFIGVSLLQILLIVLEVAVAAIQAYVLTTLRVLYAREV